LLIHDYIFYNQFYMEMKLVISGGILLISIPKEN
jgi:hypothetical protein